MNLLSNMQVGSVVKLKVPLLGNPMDAVGIAFNDYGSGTQFIFPNGELDGFDLEEQERFLEELGHEPALEAYKFSSVIRVYQNYQDGMFDVYFKKWNNE